MVEFRWLAFHLQNSNCTAFGALLLGKSHIHDTKVAYKVRKNAPCSALKNNYHGQFFRGYAFFGIL